jgi:hypothetical protein
MFRRALAERSFCMDNFFAFAYRQVQNAVFDNDKPETHATVEKSSFEKIYR